MNCTSLTRLALAVALAFATLFVSGWTFAHFLPGVTDSQAGNGYSLPRRAGRDNLFR